MLYLLGSIVLTSYLTLSFKALERLRINSFQAIVFNYMTCVATGSLLNGAFPFSAATTTEPWLGWAVLMGATFISLFNLIAFTAQKIGVAVATVANKLSLIIPFVFSIYFYQEPLGVMKIAGIALAMLAVFLTTYRGKQTVEGDSPGIGNLMYYLLPLILFFGSGLLDTMIKYVEQAFLNPANYNSYLISAFATAAIIGMITLSFLLVSGRQRFSYRSVLAGIAIGVPNYFSIWCLLKVLKENTGRSAAIIPVNNMGIVLFSAVVAWLAFSEKLSLLNWLGIGLSLVAIALIAFT